MWFDIRICKSESFAFITINEFELNGQKEKKRRSCKEKKRKEKLVMGDQIKT